MSCRTTHLGSLATTFNSVFFNLEDSQATSLFHQAKRERNDETVTDSQVRSSLNEYSEYINNSHQFTTARSGTKERANQRVTRAILSLSSADDDTRYAFVQNLRKGNIADLVINVWTKAQEETSSREEWDINPRKEFNRLVKEYRQAKTEHAPSTEELISDVTLPEGFPQDKATKYAFAIFSRSSRCERCGRFQGLPAHTCVESQTDRPPAEDHNASPVPEPLLTLQPDSNETILYASGVSTQTTYDLDATELTIPMDDFQALYDDIRAQIEEGREHLEVVPYDAPGAVTGRLASPLGGRSIGLELEFDFPDEDYPYFDSRHDLARQLHQEGITMSPYIERWHFVGDERPGGTFQVTPDSWICEFDRSVDPYEGERGIEVKSQIMYDEPSSWRNLETICRLAENLGARPTQRTGLHVNVGAHDFSSSDPLRHNNLLRLAEAYDDVLLRLAHNPASGDWHRGRAYCGFADVPISGFASVAQARARSNHYQAFNLGHLPAEGDSIRPSSRIEVRLWDGTTQLSRIQTAVNVSLLFAEMSKYRINPGTGAQPAGFHREQFGRNRLEGENWERATLSFRTLMGLAKHFGLSSETQQKNLVGLFAESRWQRPSY